MLQFNLPGLTLASRHGNSPGGEDAGGPEPADLAGHFAQTLASLTAEPAGSTIDQVLPVAANLSSMRLPRGAEQRVGDAGAALFGQQVPERTQSAAERQVAGDENTQGQVQPEPPAAGPMPFQMPLPLEFQASLDGVRGAETWGTPMGVPEGPATPDARVESNARPTDQVEPSPGHSVFLLAQSIQPDRTPAWPTLVRSPEPHGPATGLAPFAPPPAPGFGSLAGTPVGLARGHESHPHGADFTDPRSASEPTEGLLVEVSATPAVFPPVGADHPRAFSPKPAVGTQLGRTESVRADVPQGVELAPPKSSGREINHFGAFPAVQGRPFGRVGHPSNPVTDAPPVAVEQVSGSENRPADGPDPGLPSAMTGPFGQADDYALPGFPGHTQQDQAWPKPVERRAEVDKSEPSRRKSANAFWPILPDVTKAQLGATAETARQALGGETGPGPVPTDFQHSQNASPVHLPVHSKVEYPKGLNPSPVPDMQVKGRAYSAVQLALLGPFRADEQVATNQGAPRQSEGKAPPIFLNDGTAELPVHPLAPAATDHRPWPDLNHDGLSTPRSEGVTSRPKSAAEVISAPPPFGALEGEGNAIAPPASDLSAAKRGHVETNRPIIVTSRLEQGPLPPAHGYAWRPLTDLGRHEAPPLPGQSATRETGAENLPIQARIRRLPEPDQRDSARALATPLASPTIQLLPEVQPRATGTVGAVDPSGFGKGATLQPQRDESAVQHSSGPDPRLAQVPSGRFGAGPLPMGEKAAGERLTIEPKRSPRGGAAGGSLENEQVVSAAHKKGERVAEGHLVLPFLVPTSPGAVPSHQFRATSAMTPATRDPYGTPRDNRSHRPLPSKEAGPVGPLSGRMSSDVAGPPEPTDGLELALSERDARIGDGSSQSPWSPETRPDPNRFAEPILASMHPNSVFGPSADPGPAEAMAVSGMNPASALDQPVTGAASPSGLAPTAPEGQAMPKHLAADLVEGAWRADREERVELMLDPVELGRVRFELVPEGDRLQVLVSVERQDTLDLLRRNIDLLRTEFREAGFPAADLSFGQWGSGEGQRPDRHLPPPDTAHDLIPQADHAKNLSPSTPAGRTAAGGLDLRL